jgi:hypothetical protein
MKKQINLGTVIANRELTDHHTGQPVLVSIGTPQFIGDGWDWACPYVITGLGEPIHGHAHGIDALQALQLVSAAIRSDLEQSGATLSFLEQSDWQSAFPAAIPNLGSAELRAHIETLIEQEQARWLAEQGVRPAGEDC